MFSIWNPYAVSAPCRCPSMEMVKMSMAEIWPVIWAEDTRNIMEFDLAQTFGQWCTEVLDCGIKKNKAKTSSTYSLQNDLGLSGCTNIAKKGS